MAALLRKCLVARILAERSLARPHAVPSVFAGPLIGAHILLAPQLALCINFPKGRGLTVNTSKYFYNVLSITLL